MEISQHTERNTVKIHRRKTFPQGHLINLLMILYCIIFKHSTLRTLKWKIVVRVEGL